MPSFGAGDLEVHVAQVVLDARDVGEDDVVIALLDQPHRNAGDRRGDRDARRLQCHRGCADRPHRRRAVRLERLGDDPDHVREVVLVRNRRHEGPLGKRSVTDVAALGTAHETGFPHREGRKVVVVPEPFRGRQAERVEAHVHARRAQGDVGEDLGLTAGEERRAVHARGDVDLALDRPDLVLSAAVGALLLDGDPLPDDFLLQLREGRRHLSAARRVGASVLARGGVLVDDLLLHALAGSLPIELALNGCGVVEQLAVGRPDLAEQALVHLGSCVLDLLLAGLRGQLLHRAAEFLDLVVGDVQRIEDLGLADAFRARLDHEDRLAGAGDDQVHLEFLEGLLRRVDDEVARQFADADRADVVGDGDRRDRQGRRGAVHRKDVVGVDVVHGQRGGDDLGLVVPSLGEERANRTVDHARGQRGLLAGTALATEERARDLAGRVHPLLDVDRQGEEVTIPQASHRRCAEDQRVAGLDDNCAAGLPRQFAGLESDLAIADLNRNAANVKHAH